MPQGTVGSPSYLGDIADNSGSMVVGGDDDYRSSPGLGYYTLMILFWGGILSIVKIIVNQLNFNCFNLLDILENLFKSNEQIPLE